MATASSELPGVVDGAEVPLTLDQPAPRTLTLLDQLGFWGNLGVSLLGFGGAVAVSAPAGLPPLPLAGALIATVVGTALGSLVLGATLLLGARTGASAMVLLRGLLGARASAVPTALNVAQCLGWGTFELVVIAGGLEALTHDTLPHWLLVVLAGAVTTALTLRPLGVIRVLRRYVSVLVVLAVAVLAVGLLTNGGLDGTSGGPGASWTGFWAGTDAALAVAVSWVPLGGDYARHSRTGRAAVTGGAVGFGLTQIACYAVGLLALAKAGQDPNGVFDVFLALPLGVVAFAVLVLRESDQSFANVYSTAVSVQNLRPHWDRRVLSVAVGALTTLGALLLDVQQFSSFLYLIGAVFVPLAGALLAAWWRSGGRWDVSTHAPTRPAMALAWLGGFVAYQLVNPGGVAGWSHAWARLSTQLHLTGHPWLSASVTSFVVAAALAALLARPTPQSGAGTMPSGAGPQSGAGTMPSGAGPQSGAGTMPSSMPS
jgi:nucleobase:cation symporter-1, NCS1 family